jgi:hypothetical protein
MSAALNSADPAEFWTSLTGEDRSDGGYPTGAENKGDRYWTWSHPAIDLQVFPVFDTIQA